MIRMPKQSANLSLLGPASELDIEPSKIESETEVTTNINFRLRASRYLHLRRFTAVFSKSPAQRAQENAMYPTWKKVGICLETGICTVQLQFAFRRCRILVASFHLMRSRMYTRLWALAGWLLYCL